MSAAETWSSQIKISPTAMIDQGVNVGEGAAIWDLSRVREGAVVGAHTVVGRNVYVDRDVMIGANCKIQNNALLYWPATIGDGVFIGPGAILTNDRHPRAINADGTLKGLDDWFPAGVTVDSGAAIGAGVVIVGGVHVGAWALVGAGSVVTRDVPSHALVTGNPAVQVAWVGRGGRRLVETEDVFVDSESGDRYRLVDDELVEER